MGYKEIQILKDLANNDPQNKHNVVRLLDSFEDREHLCLGEYINSKCKIYFLQYSNR